MTKDMFSIRTLLVVGLLTAGNWLFAQVGIHHDQVRNRLVYGGVDFVSNSAMGHQKLIMASNLDGSNAVELYRGDGLISQLKLSPDDNFISFIEYVDTDDADPMLATSTLRYVATDGETSTIYRYRQFMLHILKFTGEPSAAYPRVQRYSWSPDSTQVACITGNIGEDAPGFTSDGVYIHNAEGPIAYQGAAIFDNGIDVAWANHDGNIYIRTDGRKQELASEEDPLVIVFDTAKQNAFKTAYEDIYFSTNGSYYYAPSRHGGTFRLFRTSDNADITANNNFLVELGDFLQPCFWRDDNKIVMPSAKEPHSKFYHLKVTNPRGQHIEGLVIPGVGTGMLATNGNTATTAVLVPYYQSAMVSDTIPGHMPPGSKTTVQVTVRNDGVHTWTAAKNYKLGAKGGNDHFAASRHLLPNGASVAPGETVTFSFTMTAPTEKGEYPTKWRMLREAVTWFGPTLNKQITVK